MKSLLLCSTTILAAVSLMAADKDDVASAVQKLSMADNYSWSTKREGGQNAGGITTKGKAQKDGLAWIEMTVRDNTLEGYVKGAKGAVKTEDGWTTVDVTAPARAGGGRVPGGMLRNFKAPAAQAEDILGKTKGIAKEGDAYAGELTEEGAKSLFPAGGGRRGGAAPAVSDAKGSVKFWITDGVISKFELKVSGKTKNRDGEEVDRSMTTTVQIKDIGSTKIELPDEAKSKLS